MQFVRLLDRLFLSIWFLRLPSCSFRPLALRRLLVSFPCRCFLGSDLYGFPFVSLLPFISNLLHCFLPSPLSFTLLSLHPLHLPTPLLFEDLLRSFGFNLWLLSSLVFSINLLTCKKNIHWRMVDWTGWRLRSFNPENHRVIWTESHPWGSVKVTGEAGVHGLEQSL